MEQLILHLFGDYITQTDWMAREKVNKRRAALIHATVYSLPFLLLTTSPLALFVIWSTHYVIDHYRLAKHVIFYKNRLFDKSLQWEDCKDTGFHKSVPPYLSVWLMIIVDNTMHLTINYLAIAYL